MAKSIDSSEKASAVPTAITSLSVSGFKSIVDEQTLGVRPLTLLAGANSSGKSSIMQPLLLLKQTLEAPYDPGPLLINGPNVKFTSARQFRPALADSGGRSTFVVKLETSRETALEAGFGWKDTADTFDLDYNVLTRGDLRLKFTNQTRPKELIDLLKARLPHRHLSEMEGLVHERDLVVGRDRFLFEL